MTRNVFTLAAVFVAFAGGMVMSRVNDRDVEITAGGAPSAPIVDIAQSRIPGAVSGAGLPDLSSIAERAIQASVNISSTQQITVDPFFQMVSGGVYRDVRWEITPRTAFLAGLPPCNIDGFFDLTQPLPCPL